MPDHRSVNPSVVDVLKATAIVIVVVNVFAFSRATLSPDGLGVLEEQCRAEDEIAVGPEDIYTGQERMGCLRPYVVRVPLGVWLQRIFDPVGIFVSLGAGFGLASFLHARRRDQSRRVGQFGRSSTHWSHVRR